LIVKIVNQSEDTSFAIFTKNMDSKKNTNWFKTWFDSPYYHLLYKHRDCDEAGLFINNLVKYFNPPPSSRFLDLACGKGRHSLFLNKKGFDVTGVDLSLESIKHASAFENERLHFYVHDMRKLFRTNYFDYVMNLFTSFGYFENDRDNQATISSAAKALKKDGFLIIDFFNAKKVIENLQPEQCFELEGIEFTIRKKFQNNFIIKQISFSDKGNKYVFEERVSALSLVDFERYFAASGLNIIHLWGNYYLEDFDINSSERLIIIGKKQ
jgi:SAM-dependent methyltransferase